MVGFPKVLNSKEDYYYIKDNFDKSLWLPAWKCLINESKDWFFDKYLASEDEATNDDIHKHFLTQSNNDGNTVDASMKYTQMVYRTNETAKIFRLGFTEEEVNKVIEEAE